MNIRTLILPLAALIAVAFASTAYSQEQVISQSMFEGGMRRYNRPPGEWQGKARRVKKTIESQFGVLKEVLEYDAEGSSRRIWEGVSNGQPLKQQNITVGLITYSKMGDAKWTWKEKDQKLPVHIPLFESKGKPQTFGVEYDPAAQEFRMGAAEHKGREALVYTWIKRFKQAAMTGKGVIDVEIITKFWLGEDGKVVKTEQWNHHRGEKFAASQYISSEWELDPTIVIRAPIIDP